MFAKVEIIDNVKIIVPFTKKEVTGTLPTLDSFYPIGYVYTQYPQQAAPSDLFPAFTWTELNYDGAFFRASGGNADDFISTGTLTPQGQSTAKNNLKITKSGGISTGHVYAWDSSANLTHSHTVYLCNGYASGDIYNKYGTYGGYGPLWNDPVVSGVTNTYSLNHRHYYSFTPSVSDNISATISGDTETRPTNYTIKVWVRTA